MKRKSDILYEPPDGHDAGVGLDAREMYTEVWFRILLAGFILAVSYHWVQGVVLERPYPSNTFLFRPWDYFNDFHNVVRSGLTVYTNPKTLDEHLPYPPAMLVFAAAFRPLGDDVGMSVFFTGFLAVLLWFCAPIYRTSDRLKTIRNALVITGMSYPVLFVLDRGNFETYAFAAVATFVYFFDRKRYWLAAPFLGLAISFKIHPVGFVALYFARGRILEACGALAYAGLFTLLALPCFPGSASDNLLGWIHNMGMFNSVFAVGSRGWPFSISLSSAVRSIAALASPSTYLGPDVSVLLQWTMYVSVALGLAIGGYVVFFQKTLWKQVLLLVVCLNFLPPVSFDYRLLYTFLPMVLLAKESGRARYEMAFVILLGLLLIPKAYCLLFNWMVLVDHWFQFEATSSVILNPLIGLALGILVFLSGSDMEKPLPVAAVAKVTTLRIGHVAT
jgi:hypothetical protein